MSATATITRPNTAHLLAFGATATVVALAVALLVRSTAANGAFWINQTLQVGTLASVAYGAGILVGTYGLKVNYARKISFFAIFLAPLVIVHLAPYHHSLETTGMRSLIGVGMFAMLAAPIRSRVPVLATMFRSFDRPEDRPHEHRDREQRERAGEKHVRGVPRVGRVGMGNAAADRAPAPDLEVSDQRRRLDEERDGRPQPCRGFDLALPRHRTDLDATVIDLDPA